MGKTSRSVTKTLRSIAARDLQGIRENTNTIFRGKTAVKITLWLCSGHCQLPTQTFLKEQRSWQNRRHLNYRPAQNSCHFGQCHDKFSVPKYGFRRAEKHDHGCSTGQTNNAAPNENTKHSRGTSQWISQGIEFSWVCWIKDIVWVHVNHNDSCDQRQEKVALFHYMQKISSFLLRILNVSL